MKKVLIWDTFPLENIGGPMGYLYNLHEYLKEHPSAQITFLSDLMADLTGEKTIWKKSNIQPKIEPRSRFGQIYRRLSDVYARCFLPFKRVEYDVPKINVDKYDYVHIHMIPHVLQFRKLFPKYKGKVILTTHCPCTWTDEILHDTASETSKLNRVIHFIRPFILRNECRAYRAADYIMFPCEGAKEPYQKDTKVAKIFAEIEDRFFYVPSSLPDYIVNIKTQQKFSEIGIPDDAFVITYFGRHIAIKGYDILREVGLKLLDLFPNLYVLCAGKGNIQAPSHPRWIELGFIRNVDDLLPQSNLYILPNRETYFDLIALQILRAGVPLVLSNTGGNKYFKELPSDETIGMRFFEIEDKAQLLSIAKNLIEAKQTALSNYNKMSAGNRSLYEKYFTIDKYVATYIAAIEQL